MQAAKYLSVFKLGLQNTFVYRWNYFLRAVFGLIPLAGTVFLWRAIFHEKGGGMRGYDYGSMIYYYLLTLLVANLVTPTEDEWQIASDIREGQINSLLTKPMSYLAYRFSIFLSGRLVYSVITVAPIALIFFFFRKYITIPSDPLAWIASAFPLVRHGGDDPVFHHLQHRDDGVLDPGNFHDRFHRLFVRILSRRPDVSDRHHAGKLPDAAKVAAVLLRTVLSGRDFSRATQRRQKCIEALAIKQAGYSATWSVARLMWRRGLGHYRCRRLS